MKNIRPIFGFGMLTAIAANLLSGCVEAPEACYTPSANLVDVNVDVSFVNCSEPIGESYLWDFGDGTTGSEANPVHRFTAEGQYLVALTAKGKTVSSDNVFKTLITAGQRLLSLASITNLPSLNPQGNAWDAGDNPDIAVRFSKGATTVYQSPTRTDAAWTFPMAVQMPSADLVLTPENWTISVLDIDGAGEEEMARFETNFATVVPTGVLSLNFSAANGAALQIAYTLRQ
ncbi:MAG: hypothetical protein RLZZ519_1918 [Bacteroidota bacterium]|jgi:hypothetical protein